MTDHKPMNSDPLTAYRSPSESVGDYQVRRREALTTYHYTCTGLGPTGCVARGGVLLWAAYHRGEWLEPVCGFCKTKEYERRAPREAASAVSRGLWKSRGVEEPEQAETQREAPVWRKRG